MRVLICSVLVLLNSSIFAQWSTTASNVSNIDFTQDVNFLTISYNLSGCAEDNESILKVYLVRQSGTTTLIDPAFLIAQPNALNCGNNRQILFDMALMGINEEGSFAIKIVLDKILKVFSDLQNTEMVYVKGGTFTMGCTAEQGSDCYSNEKPAHSVTLSSYYIGKYEVTQALWQKVMGSNPSNFSGCADCPVEEVSWDDCQEFIRKLNQMTGKKYRLPTEAEWEYAARGGSRGVSHTPFKYSGSNDIDAVAWYDNNSGSKTHPVGTKRANELGIYDMSGNVWEWCSDWYGSYSSSAVTNPTGAMSGEFRVCRGGGWSYFGDLCRVSLRPDYYPSNRNGNLGLRLVLVL